MKNILQHIAHLLNHYDCVIVPNLGGFIVRNEGAIILPNKITPPRRVISFNAQLNHNDGFLASKLAQRNGVRYNKALSEITKSVDNLLTTLNGGASIEIENIGILTQNTIGKIDFHPTTLTTFPDNFGLEELQIAPILHKQNEVRITLPLRINAFKYAVACVFLLLFWFMSPPSVQDSSVSYYSNLLPIDWEEVIKEQEQTKAENEAEELRKLLLQKQKEAAAQAKSKCKFHVIVAALDAASAEKYCAELKANKHNDARVFQNKNMCRVSIASYASKSEAIRKMRILRQTNAKHKRAWVYCE